MKGRAAVVLALLALSGSVLAQAPSTAIPAENDPHATTPPARPPAGDLSERAAQLFRAILADDPSAVRELFFPREPFLVLKGIADPGRYWGILMSHYERDVHDLHATIPAGATFDRFVMSRRGGWVVRGEEANALPYWACRHSFVYYRANDREQRFEIRTLINWGPRWYITHLN